MPSITPSLWFDTAGLEAAEFYVSIFPNSSITDVARAGDEGPVLTVHFELDGRPFSILNGGPRFVVDEAVSFVVPCADQAEVDRYWDALGDGGVDGRCGWLQDRFGVWWQVVPTELGALLGDPDPARAARATDAMLTMSKIDLAALRAAADGADG